jgi:isopenicillin-N epimerase
MERRGFLSAIRAPAVAWAGSALAPRGSWAALLGAAGEATRTAGTPAELAADEDFWAPIQRAYPVDRSMINLNNGGVAPSPAAVIESMKRSLDLSNLAPSYTMWQIQEPQRETVRASLARMLGCDAEEVAITRNASESLENLQYAFDLGKGDEVVCCDQDYPRMITTFKQRERREGIVLKQVKVPAPSPDPRPIVEAYEAALGPRTKLVLVSHVVFMTGAIHPVREVVAAARRRGIPTIVDGAHAFGQVPARIDELGCDNYSSSLHKWLSAPIGTGLLYVKKDAIKGLWPLMAAPPEMEGNIRKFEEIGTHPAAGVLAIADAIAFHQAIGGERKLARLVALRDRWAKRLSRNDRVRLWTSLAPGRAGAFATVGIDGIKPADLAAHLWSKHRIFVVAITHPQFEGLRVSPNVYTTPAEIDRFAEAVEAVLKDGLPKA